MSKVELQLLTDIDMLLMIEKGVVSQISCRYAAANNPDAPNYNKKMPHSYIMYWDANNLYGWAMSQYLPYGNFKWENAESIDEKFIQALPDNDATGYIFEVDLDYAPSLHHLHNDYPLAPEKLTVDENMLSTYAKSLLENNQNYEDTPPTHSKFVAQEKLCDSLPKFKNVSKAWSSSKKSIQSYPIPASTLASQVY